MGVTPTISSYQCHTGTLDHNQQYMVPATQSKLIWIKFGADVSQIVIVAILIVPYRDQSCPYDTAIRNNRGKSKVIYSDIT